MTEYTEQAVLVDSMRARSSGSCAGCMLENYEFAEPRIACPDTLLSKGADMIESQYRQIEELRQEIAEKDKEIEVLKREIMTYPDEEIEREERCGL